MNKMKMLMAVSTIVVVGGGVGTAYAGLKQTSSVYLSTSSRFVMGALGDARSSSDGNQNLACVTYTNTSGTSMYCWGSDSSGIGFGCSSSNPYLVSAAQSLKGDSSIYLSWDSSSTCQYMNVVNGSYLTPKAP